ICFLAIQHQGSLIRRQVHQFFNSTACLFMRPRLQQLTQNHKCKNDTYSFKIKWDTSAMRHLMRKDFGCSQCNQTEQESRSYSKCDQTEHIKVPCFEGNPATLHKEPS